MNEQRARAREWSLPSQRVQDGGVGVGRGARERKEGWCGREEAGEDGACMRGGCTVWKRSSGGGVGSLAPQTYSIDKAASAVQSHRRPRGGAEASRKDIRWNRERREHRPTVQVHPQRRRGEDLPCDAATQLHGKVSHCILHEHLLRDQSSRSH